jgi:hypothetical protein
MRKLQTMDFWRTILVVIAHFDTNPRGPIYKSKLFSNGNITTFNLIIDS